MMTTRPGVFVLMAIAVLAMPRPAVCQQKTSGYAFASPIVFTNGQPPVAMGTGGGVERWVGRGSNIGGEIENVYVPAYEVQYGCCTTASGRSEAVWLFLFNGTHYVARATTSRPRWDPFITGGIGVATAGSEPAGVLQFGGGADRWMTSRTGVRFEVQDQLVGTMMIGFRVGIIFR
jgi:hypothetical protein